ncbi:Ser/Thr protein phosphatase family protein [Aphelenchoides avenae]|nr:Ser/Thr protein phosphatase family protein [Aphelenchus avenae]
MPSRSRLRRPVLAAIIVTSSLLLYLHDATAVAQEILTPSRRLSCTGDRVCSYETESDLDFFVLGDTGGMPVYPYVTYAQKQVASAMSKLADVQKLKFVVNLGDSFYFNGVSNVFDSRFEDSFEEVYADDRLRVPWFTIAGNHDHLGNVSAQVLYTQHSSRWTFPSLYYKLGYKFGGRNPPEAKQVDIIFIDTIILCGNTIDVQGESLWNWLFYKKKTPNGPDPGFEEQAKEQWAWIEKQLAVSTADYLFVSGHYPVYSTSEHGPIQCLIDQLDPLMRKYNVTAYFSGHDHNLQHIHLPEVSTDPVTHQDTETTMDYIVSGAGSRSDRSSKHTSDVPSEALLFRYPSSWNPFSQLGFSNGGFIHVELRSDAAYINFYSGKLAQKYQTKLNPRTVQKDRRRRRRRSALSAHSHL